MSTPSLAPTHREAMPAIVADFCPMMPTYGAPMATFVRGKGTELWDKDGKRYLDFLSGLAVTSLGHAHPKVAEAIAQQANTLVHVSNLFANDNAWRVAVALDELLGGGGQVFFCNSGAEANEAALKLARKWGGRGRHNIISTFGSFHGRTLATLHMTGQPAKHEVFWPLPEGFRHAAWGDVADIERIIDDTTSAIMLEAVQGEGGVNPAPPGYFADVRRLCDERSLLFMVDEVQTGLGRTGKWFGFQHFLPDGVQPDVVTMAKALGNGFPIGACWAKREVAGAFKPGDHATTYGGTPLATAAALSVLDVMREMNIPQVAARASQRLTTALEKLDGVAFVRGLGLLLAVELEGVAAAPVQARLMELGCVTNAVTPTALRLAPPLTVSDAEIDEAAAFIAQAIGDVAAAS